jgi:hypothetical protein
MNKFKCKNNCSGNEGFSFEGNIWCSGSVDGNGDIDDGDQAPFIEVISFECNECGGSWDVGKEEKFHI